MNEQRHCITRARKQRNALGLTPRETEILRLIAEAHCDKRIARELAISHSTVKAHSQSVFRKLGTNSRTGALVRLASLAGQPLTAALDRIERPAP